MKLILESSVYPRQVDQTLLGPVVDGWKLGIRVIMGYVVAEKAQSAQRAGAAVKALALSVYIYSR